MANMEIREKAKASGVRLWQIAEKLGISEPTMTRKLRHELPKADKQEILSIIENLSREAA